MIHNKFRYILTLVALFAISTGAWAQEEVLLTTVTATGHTSYSQSPDGIVTVTLNNIDSYHYTYGWLNSGSVTVEAAQGYTITRCVFKQNPSSTPNRVLVDDKAPFTATMVEVNNGEYYNVYAATTHGDAIGDDFMNGISTIEVYGTAEPPIEVTPVAEPAVNTKQWTFSMPGSDVVLTPQYALAAKWVVEGEGDNAKTLLPTAAENIIAGTTDPIIVEGTVATSTYGEGDGAKTIDQGTVMYAVTETNTTAPALTAYSDDVPTAAIVEGAVSEPTTCYVWYYIQGADTPAEEEATDKNTFNNSEVCATPLTVTLLPNVFNLVLKPTKANDITVEVNEVDKTLELIHNATENEDTLKAVKMQSDVKIKAKTGYKFKTIEVKKGDGGPALNLTNPAVGQLIGDDGKNYNYGAVPTGVTALAKICHLDGDHGVALALEDYGFVSWNTVNAALETYEPKFTNATWDMPTEGEWGQMNQTVGGYGALRDSFENVGGTNMEKASYWSSTSDPNDDTKAKNFSFNNGEWGTYQKSANRYTRLRLAW